MITPLSQKIVGLNLCWVVAICPKIFVGKKNLLWLTQIIVGLNCVWLLLVLCEDAAYKTIILSGRSRVPGGRLVGCL